MTLVDRLTRAAPAAAFSRPQLFSSFPFPLRASATGQVVTVDTAVELIPVYSAVNLIASAVGSLPCKVYADSQPRREARSSRQWRMLHDQPNDEMASDEFWQWVTACLLLWGNAFIYKERDSAGVVQKLWPIRPSRVMVGRQVAEDGTSVRYFRLDSSVTVFEADILHIRGLGTDGLVGYSPVQLARQQLATDTAREEFLGTFMKNGLFSSVVFTHPNSLSKDAQERLREQIEDRSGWLQAGRAITLEEGATLESLTMPLEDAQFVEMTKLSEHRTAQLFGLVPPHQWGATDQSRSMTYQNSEFGGLEFVKWTLRPWLVRLEASIKRDQGMFPLAGPTLFPEFLVDALLRADTATRWNAYAVGIASRFINPEWVQQVENITLPEGTSIPDAPTGADSPSSGAGASSEPDNTADPADATPQRALPAAPLAPTRATLDILDDLRGIFRPEIRVDAPVSVMAPTQLPPDVIVQTPDHSEALLELASVVAHLGDIITGKELSVTVDAPQVTVNVPEQPAPVVNVQVADTDDEPVQLAIDFTRNPNGTLKSATVKEA